MVRRFVPRLNCVHDAHTRLHMLVFAIGPEPCRLSDHGHSDEPDDDPAVEPHASADEPADESVPVLVPTPPPFPPWDMYNMLRLRRALQRQGYVFDSPPGADLATLITPEEIVWYKCILADHHGHDEHMQDARVA